MSYGEVPWLSRAAIEEAVPPRVAREAVRAAMLALHGGKAEMPQRSVISAPSPGAVTGIKPSHLTVDGRTMYGLKIASFYPDNPARGEPAVQGVVLMLEPSTGHPLAMLDAASVTELRTAGASALATDAMSRPDSHVLALLGAGAQARAHLRALAEVRSFDDVRVWSRRDSSTAEFSAWAARHGWQVQACGDVAEAVHQADVVCTVTSSPEPILRGSWLADGAHVNAVGAFSPQTRELASDVIAEAAVVVDHRAAAVAEAGDILLAVADGVVTLDCVVGDLGTLIADQLRILPEIGRITVFKSLGLAVQDVALAAAALDANK